MPRFIILDGSTIREARDQEDIRPRKRPRVDSVSEEQSYARQSESVPLVRDNNFYIRDGLASYVLRVDDTLFKVHEHILTPSFTFRDVLSQHGKPASEEHPLELSGISVDEFRNFLWRQYASRQEVDEMPKDTADLDRLLSMTKVTYQYGFTQLHSWVISKTHQSFTANTIISDACSSETFSRLVDVAIEYNAPDLLALAVSKWSDRVHRKDIPALPAILAADRHSLPILRGTSYYAYIREIMEHHTAVTGNGAMTLYADSKLTNVQVIRLLSGYMSLVSLWERLRRSPPKLLCSGGCNIDKHRVCVTTWNDRWHVAACSSRTLGYNSADALSLLSSMREQLSVDQEIINRITPSCRVDGIDALRKITSDIRNDLPEHFQGCI